MPTSNMGEHSPYRSLPLLECWLQVASFFSLLLPEILFVSQAVTLSGRLLNSDIHPHAPHFQLHLYSQLCSSSTSSGLSNMPHLLKSSYFSANGNISLVVFEGPNLLWLAQNVNHEIGRKQRHYLVLPPSQFWEISLVTFK